jgi:hypothetical protein
MPPIPRKAAPAKAAGKKPDNPPVNAFDSIDDVPGFDVQEEIPELPKYRPSPLKNKLEQFYASIGVVVCIRDTYCGSQIINSAPDTAIAMDKLAREHPQVKRILEQLVATSTIIEVITAHTPILLAIAMHHGPENLKTQLEGMAQAMESASAA